MPKDRQGKPFLLALLFLLLRMSWKESFPWLSLFLSFFLSFALFSLLHVRPAQAVKPAVADSHLFTFVSC